ncbi:MAG: hypothetical protein KBT57_04335 [bacterium]|nr:hypothetical protein [Candidatus Limimorpha equi]
MNEEENNAQEQIVPRPEGYTIVKYAGGWTDFISLLGALIISCTWGLELAYIYLGSYFTDLGWLYIIVYFIFCLFLRLIMHKITDVKVNLKITEEGLEQTRLSGSKLYPEYRKIEWEDMKRIYLNGRVKGQDFLITVCRGVNFRIFIPVLQLFVKQESNYEENRDFSEKFEMMAIKHGFHRKPRRYNNILCRNKTKQQ